MTFCLAIALLLTAVATFLDARSREQRLKLGQADMRDLVAITGIADPKKLLRLPGVRPRNDGQLAFDPGRGSSLPAHPASALFNALTWNGLGISVAVAFLGLALQGLQPPALLVVLFVLATLHQLTARLWHLALWLELRERA